MREFFIPTNLNDYTPHVLRKPALVFYILLLVVINLFSGRYVEPSSKSFAAGSVNVGSLVDYTNKERINHDLNELELSPQLTAAAYSKAQDMLEKDYWSHFGPDGETPWQFINDSGYTYIHAGENLAKGFSTSEGVHQAWMASPTHRANILSGNYKDIGIAVVTGKLQGQETTLVVQMFGAQTGFINENSVVEQIMDVPNLENLVDSGEIKSISISKPQEGEVLRDSIFEIEGEVEYVESNVGSYSVEIFENEVKINEIYSNENEWSGVSLKKFADGNQSVIAKVSDSGVQDQVNFVIDTSPPDFNSEYVAVYYNQVDDQWFFKFLPSEKEVTAALLIADTFYVLNSQDDGFLGTDLSSAEVTQSSSIELMLTDKYGNTAVFDVEKYFDSGEESDTFLGTLAKEDISSRVAGVVSTVEQIDFRSKANLGFAIGMVAILFIQVFYYHKLKMLDKKGGFLFTFGIWIFILMLISSFGVVGQLA